MDLANCYRRQSVRAGHNLRKHYQKAKDLIAALPDPEDRYILLATFNVVPVPVPTRE